MRLDRTAGTPTEELEETFNISVSGGFLYVTPTPVPSQTAFRQPLQSFTKKAIEFLMIQY